MSSLKIKSKDNLLDFIPQKNEKFEFLVKEDNLVQIIIQRQNPLDKMVRIFKKTPTEFKVDLDEFGSYAYLNIDGKKNIYEIGNLLLEHFGESIEPAHLRLGSFMNLLKNNNFIYFKK